MDYVDYSDAALGMTYRSSVVTGGVTVDRAADAVGTAVPDWEYVTGPQGSVLHTVRHTTDIPTPGGFENQVDWFHRDEAEAADAQCWGDAHHTGSHGSWVVDGIPDTDPRSATFNTLSVERTAFFAPPGVTDELAAAWATQVDTPLEVTVSPYAP
jgi:hypothetical protein